MAVEFNYSVTIERGFLSVADGKQKLVDAVDRAMALDDSLPEAYTAKADVQMIEFDWPGAERSVIERVAGFEEIATRFIEPVHPLPRTSARCWAILRRPAGFANRLLPKRVIAWATRFFTQSSATESMRCSLSKGPATNVTRGSSI